MNLEPLFFTLVFLGFTLRIALERSDAGEQRFDKICELISEVEVGHSRSVAQKQRRRTSITA
jgi:hypothetical protein